MTKLSVNVNKVATLRNTRDIGIPSIVRCAKLCIDAGAHGITVHPRPDERHIRKTDVYDLQALLAEHPDVEYNIEGNPFHGFMELVEDVKPHQATLVPDSPDAFTSDHGWDIAPNRERLIPIIKRLKAINCRVSLFMDADIEQIKAAAELGIDRIELYTEPYADTYCGGPLAPELANYIEAAKVATELGLGINAGHDFNRDNLGDFLSKVPDVLEVSIGHALIADALELGLPETVRQYLAIVNQG